MQSLAGYAGSTKLGSNNLVCYHNLLGVGDYGKLGYGEVVGMQIPEDSVDKFADQYFSLFGSDRERPDKVYLIYIFSIRMRVVPRCVISSYCFPILSTGRSRTGISIVSLYHMN
jgi:hypothetical protein